MKTVDFLTIPWETWTTDAHHKAMLFAVELSEMKEWGIFPKFGFTLKTDTADEFALQLYDDIYRDRYAFRLDRGPLGGGSYIFHEGLWSATCGMIEGENRIDGPPEIGKPASFSIVLTGPPDFKDLLEKLVKEALK